MLSARGDCQASALPFGRKQAIARQIVQKVEDFRTMDSTKLDEVNVEACELDELCATLAELAEAHAAIAMKAFDDSERAAREGARS